MRKMLWGGLITLALLVILAFQTTFGPSSRDFATRKKEIKVVTDTIKTTSGQFFGFIVDKVATGDTVILDFGGTGAAIDTLVPTNTSVPYFVEYGHKFDSLIIVQRGAPETIMIYR